MNIQISSIINFSEWVGSAFNAVQTSVTHVQSSNPSVFETAYKAKKVFQSIHLGTVVLNVYVFTDLMIRKYTTANYRDLFACSSVGLGAVVLVTVYVVNTFFMSKKLTLAESDVSLDDPNIRVERGNSFYQYQQQGLYVAQIVSNVALACLSTTPIFLWYKCAAWHLWIDKGNAMGMVIFQKNS